MIPRLRLPFLALGLLAVTGCVEEGPGEGEHPGDCSDGADNDADGSYDCDDPGCAAAANCDGEVGDITAQGVPLLVLPGVTFEMGCTPGQAADGNCGSDEHPVHGVTLSRDVWMAQTEVTQGQWQALMGNNPSNFSSCGPECPVEAVNWWEALAFANAVSSAEGLAECYVLSGCTNTPGNDMQCASLSITSSTGSIYDCAGYRLPTEAEWENAARAGTDLVYSGSDTVDDVAWYASNSAESTHAVATKLSNAWGLYDMSGNVWEWTWDWYDGSYYDSSAGTDPTGPDSGSYMVIRGGGWKRNATNARVSDRDGYDPVIGEAYLGFRLSRTTP